MAAILHLLDQRRLIDSNGISAGGSIAFYLTGTTTPSSIYSDVDLTTPLTNPIVVGAGAEVPTIYLDGAVTYRRVITYSDGSTDETDPYVQSDYLAAAAASASAAASSATAAAASETAAETAQAGAESARDEALQYGAMNVYATWTALAAATGMAAGDFASVLASDTGTHTDPVVGGTVDNAGYFRYDNSPAGWERVGDLESQLASGFADDAQAAVGITDDQGVFPAPSTATFALSPGSNVAATFFPELPFTSTGRLTSVSVTSKKNTAAKLVIASKNGSNQFTLIGTALDVTLSIGTNTFTDELANWGAAALATTGYYLGVYQVQNSALGYENSGPGVRYMTGLPSTNTASSLAGSITMQVGWEIKTGLVADTFENEARIDALTSTVEGQTQTQGVVPATNLGSTVATGYTAFGSAPVAFTGRITSFDFWMTNAGSGKLVIATRNASDQFTLVESHDITFVAGRNVLTSWQPDVSAGAYIGIYSATTGGKYGSSGGVGARGTLGVPTTNTASISFGASSQVSIGWTLIAGLEPRVAALESADVSAVSNALTGAGFGLLAEADNTGAADATATFATARGQHPTPNVPSGTYSVTSLPYAGDGFWGAGKINVGSVRHFIPLAPRGEGLLLPVRNVLAPLAADGDPLIFVGDSKWAGSNASAQAKAFINRIEDFLNYLYAPGSDPVCVCFKTVSGTGTTPEFYGLTTGGTITIGTRGPVGYSATLSNGAYIEFTGAYAFVDVFYQQLSGAGSLVFTYNGGSAYKTVSAAGTTSLDMFTGPSATGQASSGTYRIAASGGPVEITGLVRQGAQISTAGTPNRINVIRAAFGGRQTANITNACIDSAQAMANGLSANATARAEWHIGLGLNDMLYGTSPRTTNFAAEVDRLLTRVKSHDPREVFWWLPARPTYATFSASYDTAQRFDIHCGIIADACRSYGVKLCSFADHDYSGAGLLADGIHNNDDGEIYAAQQWLTQRLAARSVYAGDLA